MKKKIAILNADERECRELCNLLESRGYGTVSLNSLSELEACLKEQVCISVIMDIDSIPIDNRTIREYTIRFPGLYFLCTSAYRFHPELKDAICYHIYACLHKPVDPDELFYWLRSIHDEANSEN
jgi:DNA-binding NtrC family response regulator